MTHTMPSSVDQAFGTLGLFLLLIVTRLAEQEATPGGTLARRGRRVLARRGLDVVAMIGWAIDTLTLPSGTWRKPAPRADAAHTA